MTHSTTDIAIVFHSGYGHTRQVAQAIAETSHAALLEVDAQGELSAQHGISWP